MKEYEIFIETMNPCGGSKYAQQEIIEAEAEKSRSLHQRTCKISST